MHAPVIECHVARQLEICSAIYRLLSNLALASFPLIPSPSVSLSSLLLQVVRRHAYLSLSVVLRADLKALRQYTDFTGQVLAKLYADVPQKKELVHEVDFGLFAVSLLSAFGVSFCVLCLSALF